MSKTLKNRDQTGGPATDWAYKLEGLQQGFYDSRHLHVLVDRLAKHFKVSLNQHPVHCHYGFKIIAAYIELVILKSK